MNILHYDYNEDFSMVPWNLLWTRFAVSWKKSHHRNCSFYDNTQYFEIRNFYMEKILTDFRCFSVQDDIHKATCSFV